MSKLIEFLDKASKLYYEGNPIITDIEFDRLCELCDYQRIGYLTDDSEPHLYQMYSLQKYYPGEQKKPLEDIEVTYTIKLDGAAISLLYVNGELVRALTRGDGRYGLNITDKILSTNNLVPLKIKCKDTIQITGEIVAPLHIPNSRNYASGSLNLKDINEFKTRALSFFAYGVYPYFTDTYDSDLQYLTKLGFNTVMDKNLQELYPSDGIVFRCLSNQVFDELGYTSKHPRGAYALKERQPGVETKLLDVEWQVGKSGKVTPVAILEPVQIEDAWISRATLNNPGYIEMLGLQIGDTVGVIRAGSIIPCITHKVDQ